MQIVNKLKRESTFLTLIFNILTFGVYGAFYMKAQTETLNEALPEDQRIPEYSMYLYIGAMIVSAFISFISLFTELSQSVTSLDDLLTIGLGISMIVWTFSWRTKFYAVTGMNNNHPLRLNGFLLFLFGLYYINYKINMIHDSFAWENNKS